MGVPIADEKSVDPVHVLTFLGLEIDTDEMMVRIPQSKMNALVAELKKFSKENKITLKDFSESEWSDNETLEIYTDSAGSETIGGSGFFSKVCRLRHFKEYYFP